MTNEKLEAEYKNLVEEYEALNKHNSAHDKLIHLIKFLNTMCNVFGKPNGAMNLDKEKTKLFTTAYQLRQGLGYLLFEIIENENVLYRNGILKPQGGWLNKGSDLYKLLRRIFNLECINDLDLKVRKSCLKDLLSFLDERKFDELIAHAEQNKLLNDKVLASVKNDLEDVNREILAQLAKINELPLTPPTTIAEKAKEDTDFLIEYLLNVAIQKGTSFLMPDVGRQAARAAGAYVGFLVFGPGGAFLGALAADVVASHAIPSTISGGVIIGMKPATKTVGKLAGGAVGMAIYPVETALTYVLSDDPVIRAQQEKCLAQNSKLIPSLMLLPPEAFPSYMQLARERKQSEIDTETIDLELGISHGNSEQQEHRALSR